MTLNTTTRSFLEQLRSDTHESHNQLESLPVSVSLTQPTLTMAAYAHYLRLMRAVIFETETRIFPMLAHVVPNMATRHKLHLIDSDLAAIQAEQRDFPTVFDLDGATIGFVLGIMYTVEGSTMGGRYIGKNVESALGLTGENGARFFWGYGHQTGAYWKEFLGVLEQSASVHGPDDIIRGAKHAFDAIHTHFSTQES